MQNINAPQGPIPCAICTKLAEFVPHFRTRQLLKFGWICSRGYGIMGVLSLVSPKFSVPPSGETMRQNPKRFRGTRTCWRSSITVTSLVGLGFHQQPRQPKTLSFLVFVCLFVTLLNVRDSAPDFTMKALEHRNNFYAVG